MPSEGKMSKEDKEYKEKMENTVHLDIDLRDLPKDVADKIRAMTKEEEAAREKEYKAERETGEARHEKRTKMILGLITGNAEEEASPNKEE